MNSILCAYISYCYWYWGTSKCVVLGTVEDGYMVLPTDDRLQKLLTPMSTRMNHQSPSR